MLLEFVKMHGIGNDFVVVEDLSKSVDLSTEAVAWFCHRHYGIGADGLILIRPATAEEADYRMLYHNADGTIAEMCGNGIRCMAKFLVDRELLAPSTDLIRIQTLAGIKPVTVTRSPDGRMSQAQVDMGIPVLDPADIPIDLPNDRVLEHPIEIDEGIFTVTAVSMGNPHAVIWVDDVDEAPVTTVGPVIEAHPVFPARTNVEFAQLAGDEHIRLRVWERGVGETLACGTGACATVVAATLSDRIDRQATIELPGGELFVRWAHDEHVHMTGPAVEVFAGTISIPEDSEDDA